MVDIGDLTKTFYVISVPNIGFTISSLPPQTYQYGGKGTQHLGGLLNKPAIVETMIDCFLEGVLYKPAIVEARMVCFLERQLYKPAIMKARVVGYLERPPYKPAIMEARKVCSLEGQLHKPDIREGKEGLLFGGADFTNLTLWRQA
jgi:hypothetical protein